MPRSSSQVFFSSLKMLCLRDSFPRQLLSCSMSDYSFKIFCSNLKSKENNETPRSIFFYILNNLDRGLIPYQLLFNFFLCSCDSLPCDNVLAQLKVFLFVKLSILCHYNILEINNKSEKLFSK